MFGAPPQGGNAKGHVLCQLGQQVHFVLAEAIGLGAVDGEGTNDFVADTQRAGHAGSIAAQIGAPQCVIWICLHVSGHVGLSRANSGGDCAAIVFVVGPT